MRQLIDVNNVMGGFIEAIYDHIDGRRVTGRSSEIARNLQKGDTVVFSRECHKFYFENLMLTICSDIKPSDVDLVVSQVTQGLHSEQIRTRSGRILFDHVWLEEYYLHQLKLIGDVQP